MWGDEYRMSPTQNEMFIFIKKVNIIIGKNEDLLQYIKTLPSQKIIKNSLQYKEYDYTIYNVTFENIAFCGELKSIRFSNCKFINCTFDGFWGFYFILKKSKLIECSFRNTRISHIYYSWDEIEFIKCQFLNVKIDESGFGNVFFIECYFSTFSLIDFNPLWNVWFISSYFENTQFESIIFYDSKKEIEKGIPDLTFENCELITTVFFLTDLRNSFFKNSTLYKTAFVDCTLGYRSLSISNIKNNNASIDISTLLKSEKLPSRVLEYYFKITDQNAKKVISDIAIENEYYSVFISYSLHDARFANVLNNTLNEFGINTFLWSNDAPAGERLRNIMANSISKYDMVLFISSKNSIFSNACQYELLECRLKQIRKNTSLLIPIHLDNRLFDITKDELIEMNNQDECWNSIIELRGINSINFSQYANAKYSSKGFKILLDKVKDRLKK